MYYDYCRQVNYIGKVNHGILGGELLFSTLMKAYRHNYDLNLLKTLNNSPLISFNEFSDYDKGLIWEEKLIDVYRKLADIVMNHNIWSVPRDENSEIRYREYGLEKLKYFNKQIGLEEALLFITCLVDTIDPY
jgi:hypothetical protein